MMRRARDLQSTDSLLQMARIPSERGHMAVLCQGSLFAVACNITGRWVVMRGSTRLATGVLAEAQSAFRVAAEHVRRFAQHKP
jgi:hypothetical protein